MKQRHAYLDLLRLSESAAERKLLYELADVRFSSLPFPSINYSSLSGCILTTSQRTFRCKQGPEYDHEYRDADLPPTSPYSRPHQLRDVPYMRHDALPQCSVTAYQHLHRGPTYQQPNTVSLLDNSWLRTQNTAADMFYQFAVIYFIFVAFVLLARWVVLLLRWVMMVGTRQE